MMALLLNKKTNTITKTMKKTLSLMFILAVTLGFSQKKEIKKAMQMEGSGKAMKKQQKTKKRQASRHNQSTGMSMSVWQQQQQPAGGTRT